MFHTNSITMLFLFVWDYWKPTYIIHWFIFQCIEWHFAECLCFSARSIQGKNSINRVLMILTCLSNTKIFCRHHSPSCLGSLASLLLMAGEVWCYFSCLFVRVQAACLCARLGHLGEGARQMAGRRRDLMEQELRARREAEAHFLAYVRGRGRRRS